MQVFYIVATAFIKKLFFTKLYRPSGSAPCCLTKLSVVLLKTKSAEEGKKISSRISLLNGAFSGDKIICLKFSLVIYNYEVRLNIPETITNNPVEWNLDGLYGHY